MRFSCVVLFQGLGPLIEQLRLKSSVDRRLSCSRLPETQVKNKITITIVVCIDYCSQSTLVHTDTVSYFEFYLFRKQKPIKIVRKERTQLTVRVVEITMEMR